MSLAPGPGLRSREWVANQFDVSERLVRSSRQLTEEQGILPKVTPKNSGKRIADHVISAVQSFYEDPEISRTTPGMKDCKTVKIDGIVERKGKRLLLYNISEAHRLFHFDHPEMKIGLSKFFMLRPKWVVTADSSRAHYVCVCIHHQNPKLMAEGVALGDYKELMNFLVCCMHERSMHVASKGRRKVFKMSLS